VIFVHIIFFTFCIEMKCKILWFYLMAGGYDKEEKAAKSYDLAALKYWGTSTTTNFPVSLK
jgi:hypothetical protein